MLEQLFSFAQSNQQVAAALTLVVGGVATWALRNIPMQFWNLILSQSTSEIELDNSNYWEVNSNFTLFRKWYVEHGLLWMSRRFVLESNGTITAGQGNQYFVYKGRLFWFNTEHLDSSGVSFRKQVLRIRGLTRSQALMQQMIKDATQVPVTEKTTISVNAIQHIDNYSYHFETLSTFPIQKDLVPLVNTDSWNVIEDTLSRFTADKEWFEQAGMAYKRCFLFSGPPGTGKSTLAVKIASMTARDIYTLPLDTLEIGRMVSLVPPGSIVLLEDVHSSSSLLRKELQPDFRMSVDSLTSILNVLSGAIPLNDIIVIMTTNYKERLTPELYRPGRVDVDLEIGYLDDDAICKWLSRVFGSEANPYIGTSFPYGITTGLVYSLYERHRDDVSSIVAGLLENKAEDRPHVGQDQEDPRRPDQTSLEAITVIGGAQGTRLGKVGQFVR